MKSMQFPQQVVLTSVLGLGIAFAPLTTQAALVFDFDYSQNIADVGFLDPVEGAARRSALETAGTMYSNLFGQYFDNMGTIGLLVGSTDDPSSGTLASAGSFFVEQGSGNFGGTEVIRNKLQNGVDLNGSDVDGEVNVNWGANWELDPNGEISVDDEEFDFFAALIHEFTHAMGFATSLFEDGSPLFGTSDGGDGEWTAYDKFLVDVAGVPMIGSDFILDQTAWDEASVGGTSPGAGLFFNGPNAVAANGGNPVGLYSPTTFVDGSSIVHLDTDNPQFATSLMKHDRDFGPETRTFSAIELGILEDVGYSRIATVPAPSTVGLLLAGLGFASFARKKSHK